MLCKLKTLAPKGQILNTKHEIRDKSELPKYKRPKQKGGKTGGGKSPAPNLLVRDISLALPDSPW